MCLLQCQHCHESLLFVKGIRDHFEKNTSVWKTYFDSAEPQSTPLPGDWNTRLNDFQKLLVLRTLRADKVVSGIQNYLSGILLISLPIFLLSLCQLQPSDYLILTFYQPIWALNLLSLLPLIWYRHSMTLTAAFL